MVWVTKSCEKTGWIRKMSKAGTNRFFIILLNLLPDKDTLFYDVATENRPAGEY